MICPACDNNNTRTASKLAYREGVYFCLDCATYFPNKKLIKIMDKETLLDYNLYLEKEMICCNCNKQADYDESGACLNCWTKSMGLTCEAVQK